MTSCIFTIIKNEQLYLDEFIKYSLNLGINHIIVLEDIGSESHYQITSKYDSITMLSVYDLYNTEEKIKDLEYKRGHNYSMQNYYINYGLSYIKENFNYDWCFVIDIDEYLTIDDKFDNINEVLTLYKDYDAVLIQWKNYGANGLIYKPDYNKQGIQETYTKPCALQKFDKTIWYQSIKTVYNMHKYYDDIYNGDHLPQLKCNWCRTDFSKNDTSKIIYDNIYLRHYITKSFEEYVHKLKVRGMFHLFHRKYEDFFDMNDDMIDKKDKLLKLVNTFITQYQKTILLTGSDGFIGHNLYSLIYPLYHVICVDKKSNIDILDYNKLEKIFSENNIDIVIHLASIPGVRYSIDHSQEVLNNNIIGFENICKLSAKYNVKHVIYASSSSVYGDNNVPKSPYAVSKCTNELQASMYASLYPNIKFTGLRFFTVYGHGIRKDLFIYRCIYAIKTNAELHIYGDGTKLRDFTYVQDICKAIKLIIESDKQYHHEVFDIGYGKSISVNEVVDILKELINPNFDKVIYENDKPYDVQMTLSDTTKLQEYFNFKPEIDIKQGLRQII